jgi:hypothetical protein
MDCLIFELFVHDFGPLSKMPDQDADFLTPATRLLEKKREMAEVEEALVATKEVSTRVY